MYPRFSTLRNIMRHILSSRAFVESIVLYTLSLAFVSFAFFRASVKCDSSPEGLTISYDSCSFEGIPM